MASSSRLKPGEEGKINMSVDPAGKKGLVTKTAQVITNDPAQPVITLTLTLNVKDSLHSGQFNATRIFGDGCRDCHVERGRGKKGLELFMADCFMCHNAGMNTSISGMSKRPEKELLRAIADGVQMTMMPAWGLNKGGPLSESEIESLIKIIKKPN